MKNRIGMIPAVLTLLGALVCGCKDPGPAGAPAQQPVPVPSASVPPNGQLPLAVSSAFTKDRKDATIIKVKHRMNPDGVVHYTIDSIDSKQVHHEDEYRADGVKVSK